MSTLESFSKDASEPADFPNSGLRIKKSLKTSSFEKYL